MNKNEWDLVHTSLMEDLNQNKNVATGTNTNLQCLSLISA